MLILVEKAFEGNITILFAFYSKFATFPRFWKKSRFFSENHNFFWKTSFAYLFEKSNYFIYTLRKLNPKNFIFEIVQ